MTLRQKPRGAFAMTTYFLNPIPIIVKLLEMTISIFKGSGFRVGEYGFSMGVLVYGFEDGIFLRGCIWVF